MDPRMRMIASAFSPDGKTIASASDDNDFIIRTFTFQLFCHVNGDDTVKTPVAYSTDGNIGGVGTIYPFDGTLSQMSLTEMCKMTGRFWVYQFY